MSQTQNKSNDTTKSFPTLSGVRVIRAPFLEAGSIWAAPDVYDGIKNRVDVGAYIPAESQNEIPTGLLEMPAISIANYAGMVDSTFEHHVAEFVAEFKRQIMPEHKRGVDNILDPLCECGHAWSDHSQITKQTGFNENPKDANSANWKKVRSDASINGNNITWLCEDSRGACMRSPSGCRCKCTGYKGYNLKQERL